MMASESIVTTTPRRPIVPREFFDPSRVHWDVWGRVPYREAWARQKDLLEKRIRNEIPDTIVFCEHPAPVITLGRASQREGTPKLIPPPGTELIEIERGGQATWHGPGQLVIYPIVRLDRGEGRGVVSLIRALEEWVINGLTSLDLCAQAVEGSTGVWISGERKIASIGIAASHWVSYHGLALNYATGADPWRSFSPCGFSPEVMTDLQRETNRAWTFESTLEVLRKNI